MPESISCPKCRRLLQVPEDYRGRAFRCPECREVFVGGATTEITAQAPPLSATPKSEVQAGPSPRAPAPWATDEPEDDAADLAARVARRGEFRSGAGLALAVKFLLAANLLLSLVTLGTEYLQYELATRLVARQPVPEAELAINDVRQGAVGFAHLGVAIATAIVFLMWFYRAHANLKPLGARELTYTPGNAVGYWFVPFLNLYHPVKVAQEIWRNSDPDAIRSRNDYAETPANSVLIGFWWAIWIVSGIVSYISARMIWNVTTPESLQAASAASMMAEVVSIVTALLCLAVVARIDARQTARAEAMQERDRRELRGQVD